MRKRKRYKKITVEQKASLASENEYTRIAKQSCELMLTKVEIAQTMVKFSPKAK